ncbi:MAG: hypothetical protein ABI301_05005 [Jatrophihabitantaceae bacterium]
MSTLRPGCRTPPPPSVQYVIRVSGGECAWILTAGPEPEARTSCGVPGATPAVVPGRRGVLT